MRVVDGPAMAGEADVVRPMTPYAAAKWMGEGYAAVYNQRYATEFVGLRITCPRQPK